VPYPSVETSTLCEEKKVTQWIACARFPIARMVVSEENEVKAWTMLARTRLTGTGSSNDGDKSRTVRQHEINTCGEDEISLT
jgi:hypothetical protein